MKKFLVFLAVLIALAWVGSALFPYLVPVDVALGPCGRDLTSPTSYLPRSSPTRSEDFTVGEVRGKICYGSPSARGREIFGGLVRWGDMWRTGANEPTRVFVDGPIELVGVRLDAGRYSLYSLPQTDLWQIFVSRSTFHWGNAITESVRALEVGMAEVPVEPLAASVESLRFRFEPDHDGGVLALEWERTRIELPVRAVE